MQAAPFAARVADASEDALLARGDAGLQALGGLRGEREIPEGSLRSAVIEASSEGELADERAVTERAWTCTLDAERLVVIGDLHGRWDVAEATLKTHGILDGDGHWCAPAGTVVVQIGDLLDANLRFRPEYADGTLAEAFAPWIARTRESLSGSVAASFEAGLADESFAERHTWVAACLVRETIAAMRRLEREAAAVGGAWVVLAGNHEVDLLSGRCWWSTGQKRAWLELEGIAWEAPWQQHTALQWLAARPVVARCAGALMMHGGPTSLTTSDIARDGVEDFEALSAWLETRCGPPFSQEFLAEGRSLLSPERARDDFVANPSLVQPWLELARCDWLVVGHSPFLGFPAGAWPDASAPEVRARLERLERLGLDRNVLATDTNLKRSEHCEVLELTSDGGPVVLEPDGGRRSLLDPGEPVGARSWQVLRARRHLLEQVDALRGPVLMDLKPVGVSSQALSAVMSAVEQSHDPDALRPLIGAILRAGPGSLERVSAWLELGDRGAMMAHVEALSRHIESHAARVEQQAGETLRFYADLREGVVDGVRYRLVEAVLEAAWRRARAEGRPLRPAAAAQLVSDDDQPAVRVMVFRPGEPAACDEAVVELEGRERSWEALEAQALELLSSVDLAHLAGAEPAPRRVAPSVAVEEPNAERVSAGPASSTRTPVVPRALAQAWLDANRAELLRLGQQGELAESVEEALSGVELGDGFSPGFFDVRGPWPRLRGLVCPDGLLVMADTSFVHPAARFVAVELSSGELVSQTDALWERWSPPGEVVLYSHLKAAVLERLRAGEMEQLRVSRGTDATQRWSWDAGCFLFSSPSRVAASRFSGLNPHRLEVQLAREDLVRLVRAGRVGLGVMLDDAGVSLDAPSWLGEPSAALELVGLGSEGVRALWERRSG